MIALNAWRFEMAGAWGAPAVLAGDDEAVGFVDDRVAGGGVTCGVSEFGTVPGAGSLSFLVNCL